MFIFLLFKFYPSIRFFLPKPTSGHEATGERRRTAAGSLRTTEEEQEGEATKSCKQRLLLK